MDTLKVKVWQLQVVFDSERWWVQETLPPTKTTGLSGALTCMTFEVPVLGA